MFRRNPIPVTHESGIAIGPILFVIAILGIIGTVMSTGMGNFGIASVADRITADVVSQANLIRAKINECNLKYGTATGSGGNQNYDGYPLSNAAAATNDPVNGAPVSQIGCAGDATGQQNLWSGARPTLLPQPTNGFTQWYYINTDSATTNVNTGTTTGGRCIWTKPTASSPKTNQGITQGLIRAAAKFNSSTSYSASTEVIYDPNSTSQKFIVWITLPTGTANANCLP